MAHSTTVPWIPLTITPIFNKDEIDTMIFSISYDLRKPGTNYDALYDMIKSASGWAHAMDSLWFIKTTESVEVWSNRLHQVLDQNDWIFVVDITGQSRQGWMNKKVWDWLNSQVQKPAYVY